MHLDSTFALTLALPALLAGAYLLGSIPSGLLVARLAAGADIRAQGSGNIGMVNVFRAAGFPAAVSTFFLDGLKGFLPVYLGIQLDAPVWALLLVAACAIAGHNWSLFLRGRGGKGVATSVGAIAALMPVVALIGIGLWVIVALSSRYASLASLMMIATFPVLMPIFGYGWLYWAFGLALVGLAIYRHRHNIVRLWDGAELKIARPRPPAAARPGD
jgi:acyl phosphate:glycerol-3-phosphate acyltransferase